MCLVPAVLLLFTILFQPFVSSQFFNPTQRREVWRIGETRKVQYNTRLKNYTIALWQQAMAGGSASRGPILFETTEGPKREFTWKVDLGKLDLGASNIFFFWAFEGDNSVQGQLKIGREAFSSAYFNITDEPANNAPKSSTRTTTATTLTTRTTFSVVLLSSARSSTVTAKSAVTTTSTATRDPVPVPVPPAATEPGPTDKTKAEDDISASNTSSTSSSVRVDPPGTLSVGAQAGLGVGVGLVGVACVLCMVLWHRFLKRKSQGMVELQGTACLPPKPPGYSRGERILESPIDNKPGYYVNRKPVEMD